MRVLITGGAGFIGSHLCGYWLQRGAEVVAFDNLILGRKAFLAPFAEHAKFRFVQADLTDLEKVKLEMKGADLVMHMAANSDISQGAARTDVDMQNGTVATYNVLEAMRVCGVRQLIFASSSAIYGEATVKPTPESYGPLEPISFYGASKLACEAMVSAFSHNCEIEAWVYRFANIVGSNSTHGAIHDFVGRLMKRPEQLDVLGNGTQRKSYLHVGDCIDGMMFGFENVSEKKQPKAGRFHCFNLASRGVSNVRFIADEVVRQMHAATGKKAEIHYGASDRGWVGDVPYTHLDGGKFEAVGGGRGWRAREDSDGAVRLAVGEVIAQMVKGQR